MPVRYPAVSVLLQTALRWATPGLLGTASLLLLTASRLPADWSAHPAKTGLVADDSVAYRLRGRVLDAYTQEPLPFVSLWLKRLDQGTLSDEQGYFTFELTTAQLDSVTTDSLRVQALAFRRQSRLLRFRELPADSVLQLVLARDSTVKISPGLLVQAPRRRGQAPAPGDPTTNGAAGAAPRRTFWQRLFGPKQ